MHNQDSFPEFYKQNNKLPIRLVSPDFGHLPATLANTYGLTLRKSYYFFVFMIQGISHHGVDLQQFEVKENELLFILPNQIHRLPASKQGTDYFKLGFDNNCLSLLPKQYPFLINPFSNQQIKFDAAAATRLQSIFKNLKELLGTMDTGHELILAHLNSLLTEINAAYFSADKNPADDKLSKYIQFNQFVEDNFTTQPTINDIAQQMGINVNNLYAIVKHYSGMAPKEFITKRLILEAKRRLYYSESSSIKELAYSLGFNDPEYFSRLFKKATGKSIALFVQDLSGN